MTDFIKEIGPISTCQRRIDNKASEDQVINVLYMLDRMRMKQEVKNLLISIKRNNVIIAEVVRSDGDMHYVYVFTRDGKYIIAESKLLASGSRILLWGDLNFEVPVDYYHVIKNMFNGREFYDEYIQKLCKDSGVKCVISDVHPFNIVATFRWIKEYGVDNVKLLRDNVELINENQLLAEENIKLVNENIKLVERSKELNVKIREFEETVSELKHLLQVMYVSDKGTRNLEAKLNAEYRGIVKQKAKIDEFVKRLKEFK